MSRVAHIIQCRDGWGLVRERGRLMLTEAEAAERSDLLRQTQAGWLFRAENAGKAPTTYVDPLEATGPHPTRERALTRT